MTVAGAIKSGTVYKWVGLDGQYENTWVIRVGSMTATCLVNAQLLDENGDSQQLLTIGASDLVAAVQQGWLVPKEGE